MRPARRYLLAALAAALLLGIGGAAYWRFGRAADIPVAVAAQGAVAARVVGPGTVQARVPVTVSARVGSTVVEVLAEPDFAKAVVALRLAVLFMHSRIDIDFSLLKLRVKNRIELEIRREWVAEHPTLSYWLEKEQENWDEVGVDLTIRTSG